MYVKEINEIKKQLENMRSKGLIESWSLPYENLLTRLSAAVFFLTPVKDDVEIAIWKELGKYEHFSFRLNNDKKLSDLMYRITFNKDEKEKNLQRLL